MEAAARPSFEVISNPLPGFNGELTADNLQMLAEMVRELDAELRHAKSANSDARVRDLEDQNAGHVETIKSQSRKIGALERRLTADDPEHHPQQAEITALIERWRNVTDHPKAKASKDRFELIRARLKDGYSIEQIELAIEGLGAFRFVHNAQRVATGEDSERYDQLKHALKGGQELERFANLGHAARKAAS